MRKKATLVHASALVKVVPLVGGYLKAYAETEPEIRANWDIQLFSAYYRTPASEIIHRLVREAPDVIAFSVYTWNVGLILRLIPALRGVLPPTTQFILGGNEVMNGGNKYLDPAWENVVLCNGEGEKTFRDYLLQAGQARPRFDEVKGLSFMRDGQLHTTEDMPRLKDLSEIPSPWLSDVFDAEDLAEIAMYETNRGCPFYCEFCYWGGAIGQKIYKFEMDRLRDEITYIAKRGAKALTIVDANFGTFTRDVELAAHIAAMKQEHGSFSRVVYNSAKNNPERVAEIAEIFRDAGLLHTHTISLQSLDARALHLAKRDNIKTEDYLQLQRRLNQMGKPSLIELIWPLPGETLDSFKDGVDKLCAMGSQSFKIYPLLWLNNSGYAGRTEELGISTLREADAVGHNELVIRTNEVTFSDFVQGLLFAQAVFLLHNCRGLYTTALILHRLGLASFRQLFDAFVDFMDRNHADDAICRLWHEGSARFEDLVKWSSQGQVAEAALHSARKDFDRLLAAFLSEHPEWMTAHGGIVRAAFEFDLHLRPYPFVQTPFEVGVELQRLKVRRVRRGVWGIDATYDFPAIIKLMRAGEEVDAHLLEHAHTQIDVDHRQRMIFQMPKTEDENYWHMHQLVNEIGNVEPLLETRPAGHPRGDEPRERDAPVGVTAA